MTNKSSPAESWILKKGGLLARLEMGRFATIKKGPFCAPQLKGLLVSLALGKDGYDGFLANKKNTPLMDPKAPNISQAIM